MVDDDAGLLHLMSKSLRREGFSVTIAASGSETEEKLREDRYMLLVVDLRLQDTTGQALLEKLKARGIEIPFVVITGQGDERVAVEMMRQGALDYLVKDAEFLDSMPTRVRRAVESVQQRSRLIEAEQALKREHAFISAILNTAGALVIVLDSAGRIVRFNRAAEQATGLQAEEVMGQPYSEFLVPEEDQAATRDVFERIRAGETEIQRQGKLRTKNGEIRLIAWSNTQIVGDSGESGFVLKTGIDITERRRLEEQIIEISGREQRRIGQDLHDGLGQHLTGIELMTQCLAQALQAKKRPEAEQATKITNHVREAIRQSKALARGLSPVELDRHGLMSAIKELASSTKDLCRVECIFECPEEIHIEDNLLATQLYRIAQEAVNNAVKHGRARRIVVRLALEGKRTAVLLVRDDGVGFDPKVSASGMGLGIMRYRAAVIAASLQITSSPHLGTEMRCTFKYGL